MTTSLDPPIVGIVGPCGSGKSTLAAALRQYPLKVHHIAQEHSFVPTMWQRLVHPDLLIFLDASFSIATLRRRLNWTIEDYIEQQRRLQHARQHADLYLLTDQLSPQEVCVHVLNYLQQTGIQINFDSQK